MTVSTSITDTPSENDIHTCLKSVVDPSSGKDVITAGLISGIRNAQGKISFLITIDAKDTKSSAALGAACEDAVARLAGVKAVHALVTAHHETAEIPTRAKAVWNTTPLEQVNKIIAVASGKGGVGKSTVAAHLAMALAHQGARVGLLDADIYGPSVPTMFGIGGQPEIAGGKMQPKYSHGVGCMSIGLITEEAAILRGPMITKSLQQMLRLTTWGTKEAPLDILLVDMPPGTGDVHLSLVQQAPIAGAIIVTTPQRVAVKDAEKCATMFQKVGVPIIGIVENMSYLPVPGGENQKIFGEGGGHQLANACGVPMLAQLPIDPALGQACDAGQSLLETHAASKPYFLDLATCVLNKVSPACGRGEDQLLNSLKKRSI